MQIWASVPGLEGRYQVSDLGNVRSCNRLVKYSDRPPRMYKGQLLRPSPSGRTHYRSVTMDGKTFAVHKLVLFAFRGPPPPRHEGRHLNGIKSDCSLPNLVWATHKVNEGDKVAHRTRLRGKRHPNSKLTDAQVIELRSLAAAAGKRPIGKMRRHTGPRLAAQFGISLKYAQSIVERINRITPILAYERHQTANKGRSLGRCG